MVRIECADINEFPFSCALEEARVLLAAREELSGYT